jgi:hypothetical protein
MLIGGEYDSPEKEYIRKHLWDEAFVDLIQGQGQKADSVTVLDLPGARCTYLQHLIDQFGVVKTNMVAAEQHEEPFLAIHAFLEGSGSVFEGLIENLCDQDKFASYFPIDVANLDFCGQGFVFPNLTAGNRSQYQRRWDCIKHVMDSNRRHDKASWYLLLTLSCNRNNEPGKDYLLSQLQQINHLTGTAKDPSRWSDGLLIQQVVPKIIADEALQRGYVPHCQTFDSYRYVQTGHKMHMVAWRIRLDLDTGVPHEKWTRS